jgi:hypothetical protein
MSSMAASILILVEFGVALDEQDVVVDDASVD